MALSFSEKRGLQKEVQNHLAGLNEKPDFKTKRSLQKQLSEALMKLGEKLSSTLSLLERFLANEFVNATVKQFLDKLKLVIEENHGANFEILRAPIIAFCDAHKSEMVALKGADSGVLESAMKAAYPEPGIPLGVNVPNPLSGAIRQKPAGLEYGDPQTITIDVDTEFDSPQTFREIIRAIEQARADASKCA